MSLPAKINYKMYQGSTFREVFRWESATKVYKPITAISRTAPVVITSPSHELPLGWRCRVTGASGMKQINSLADDYYVATAVDVNTVTINRVNATTFGTYSGGGMLEYNKPIPLDGITARMQIRQTIDSTDIIAEATTENGGITINVVENSITIHITAEQTAAMNFINAIYSVELVNGSFVIPFISGSINLVKEATR